MEAKELVLEKIMEIFEIHNTASDSYNKEDLTCLKEEMVIFFLKSLADILNSFCDCAGCEAQIGNFELACEVLKSELGLDVKKDIH